MRVYAAPYEYWRLHILLASASARKATSPRGKDLGFVELRVRWVRV